MTPRSNRNRWRISLVCGLLVLLPAILYAWDEETFFQQKRLSAHAFVLPRSPNDWRTQTVIGSPTEYVVQAQDTTLDIARAFGLGYNEMSGAFPGVDPWLPPVGQTLNLPTFWVLPQSGYEGVVVNIPEMRLYYFPPLEKGLSNRSVITLPAGLGREDWPTPKAKFTIRSKTINPMWVIPESIKKERIQEKGWTEDSIPGGSPDNPLGKYRIELTLPLYGIHDTNNPWAIGRLTTHGCIRLYPEDIAQFFDLIRIGVPGEFVYQPVKLGVLYGKVYAEVHDDIYQLIPDIWAEAQRVVRESGWADLVDQTLLTKALMAKSGVPTDVTKGSQLVEMAGVVQRPNAESDQDRGTKLPIAPQTATAPRTTEVVATTTPEVLPQPHRRTEKRVRNNVQSASHVRLSLVKPNVLKFRSYFDTLSDWESGVRNGIQPPHRQEIPSP